MKHTRRISLLALFSLCTVIGCAERSPEPHSFQTLTSSGKITYKNDNKIGVTDLLTYACTGGAVFDQDFFSAAGSKKICINFPSSGSMVTTTAADSVAGVSVDYYYTTGKLPSIELRLSRDSIHWTDPIEPTTTNAGSYVFNFVPGRYHIRLTSKNSNKASINRITYSFGWCNCFLYIPE